MLGHMACAVLASSHEVMAFSRAPLAGFGPMKGPGAIRQVNAVDALVPGAIEAALGGFRPDAVLNCIGLIKQNPEAHDAILAVQINALLPHRLAVASRT